MMHHLTDTYPPRWEEGPAWAGSWPGSPGPWLRGMERGGVGISSHLLYWCWELS